MTARGILRTTNFEADLETLAQTIPSLREAVEGALWSLKRSPENHGVLVPEIGAWRARLVNLHPTDDVLLYYAFTPRLLHALCLTVGKG